MGSLPPAGERPHAVMMPYPAQGHVTPMLKLAKLLHTRGFHVTFVNNEFNHRRLLRSQSADKLRGLPAFRMGSLPPAGERPHAVMMPYPAQGHVTPMLKLAKLLHTRGFHVTFVNNEFNHLRLLGAQQSQAAVDRLCSLPGFRFATIADGLPPSDLEASRDTPALIYSTMTTCRPRFKELVVKLNEEAEASGGAVPPVTCVVADSITSFAISVARELGLRCAVLWTASACGFMGYYHYKDLLDRGLVPLKEEAQLSNGYLDMIIDWIPAMPKDLRLRDLPSYLRTTDPDDIMFNFFIHEVPAMSQASAVVINTWDELDAPLLDAMSKLLPPIYTAGPLHLTARNNVPEESPISSIGSNLWKEQDAPVRWLDGRPPRSVVHGDVKAALPPEFYAATEGRSMLSTWCPQQEVLEHEAVGVFLTHSGWNSSLEGICGGVPMVCWPFFAEQQTNCRFKCTEWGIGMEIGDDVRRTEVEAMIREAMEGEQGREMRRRVLELRQSAVASARRDGRSMRNVDRLIKEVLLA
ncbi:UDP-glycosyltransferase 85A2 [Triticum urartu]|uniref:Glycosyltransferase n=1 Tax=Triticum urartu TaxID=4572 RepID=M8AB61_TRIUA|nr:UDP-glycosyltransferase 85A2 [Triticum urartu]